MDLSYIVPVYNTEGNILSRCFESVLSCEQCNFEVIIVDDGSTDRDTINTCIEYSKRDNFRLISCENAGVSHARNVGIKNANGKYVYFLDSDDELTSEKINWDEFDNSDVIVTSLLVINKDKKEKHSIKQGELTSNEYILELFRDNYFFGPVSKYIRRDFLLDNGLFFKENMINGEDAVFNFQLAKRATVVKSIDLTTYIYWHDTTTWEKRIRNNFNMVIDNYFLMEKELSNQIAGMDCKEEDKKCLTTVSKNRLIKQILGVVLFMRNSSFKEENMDYLVNSIEKFETDCYKHELSCLQKLSLYATKKKKLVLIYIMLFIYKIKGI